MRAYMICPVRGRTDDEAAFLESFAQYLEEERGAAVYLPGRDTCIAERTENVTGIISQNLHFLANADMVYVYYNPSSIGSHFDLGMAWALDKPLYCLNIDDTLQYARDGDAHARAILERAYPVHHVRPDLAEGGAHGFTRESKGSNSDA